MINEQELNKKLAEWVGWTHIPYKKHPDGYKINDACWLEPDYKVFTLEHWKFNPPDFTESLDACFKWLVPEVIDNVEKDSIEISILCPMVGCEFWVVHIRNRQVTIGQASAETMALAFCLAIEKLIDSEKSK